MWALICGIWSGSQFVPGTVETFATILKAKWEYIDTKTQFRPATMYGDFWSRDKTTVWQQYLFSELHAIKVLGVPTWSEKHSMEFGQILQAYLLAGAPSLCWITSLDETPEYPTDRVVQLEMISNQKETACVHAVVGGRPGYLPVNTGAKWSLREWIDCSDAPNKSTLLKLIDERAPSEHTNQSLSKRNPARAWGPVSPETERSGAGKMTASLAVLFMGKPPPSCSR